MKKFPELLDLNNLEALRSPHVRFKTLETVSYKGEDFPIRSITIGSEDKSAPTLGLFGGVHGLERIGSQVVIAFFNTLIQQLSWDENLIESMKNFRIVSIPIINPVGVARFSRSNGNNVDLMRNAPVEAVGRTIPLASGHRVSPMIPWYRGEVGVLEKESQTLINFVKEEMFGSKISIALDVHSGFGMKDQIWYPYAKTKDPFPLEREAQNLRRLLDKTYAHHIYKFEPQADNYLTHGDLWDYIFDEFQKEHHNIFMPLTLELGSWSWIRKNPLQLFSKVGLFHPIKEHRQARIMRRHILLFDFLIKALRNPTAWK